MNATQTAVLEALTASNSYHTVAELVDMVGKSETTVRKAVKELLADGTLSVDTIDGKAHYTNTPEVADQDESPKRRYVRHDKPTTRTVRLNQITHSEVRVALTAEEPQVTKNFGVSNKWVTICVTHNAATGSDKVLDAHYASTYPTFCPTCAPKLEGKVGRRRQLAVAS